MDVALTVLPRSGSAIDVCTAVTNEVGMVRHLGTPEVAALVIRGFELANVLDCRVVVLSKMDDRAMIKEPAGKSAASSARRASRSRCGLRPGSRGAAGKVRPDVLDHSLWFLVHSFNFCKPSPSSVARVNDAMLFRVDGLDVLSPVRMALLVNSLLL